MSEHVTDLWREILRLKTAAPPAIAFNDLDAEYMIALAGLVGYSGSNLNDASTFIARFFNAHGFPEVDPVMAHGRVAPAVAASGRCYNMLKARGNRNDIWREFLLEGASTVKASVDLSENLVMTKDDGTTITGTYTRTATNGATYYNNGNGLLVAAVDNTPYRHRLFGMYFEIASSNLALRSADFSNSAWTKTNCSIVETPTVLAPDGVSASEFLKEASDVALQHSFINLTSFVKTASVQVAGSVYVKAGGRRFVRLRIRQGGDASNRVDGIFDLENGGSVVSVAAAGTYSVPSAGVTAMQNGWVRITVAGLSGTDTGAGMELSLLDAAQQVVYNGDGVSGVYVWGAQYENNTSVATSLMLSAASVATRSAPSLSFPVTAYDILPAAGVEFSAVAEVMDIRSTAPSSLYGRVFNIVGETSRFMSKNTNNTLSGRYGTTSATGTVPQGALFTARMSVNPLTSIKLAADAAVLATQLTVTNPTGSATSLRIGSSAAATDIWHGFIKRLSFIEGQVIA